MSENVVNINEPEYDYKNSSNIEQFGPECEFNHQHFIAEGAAGLLFHIISQGEDGFIPKSVLTSAIYSIDSAVTQMDRCFQAQLEASEENIFNDITAVFKDKYPQLKQARMDAVANDTTLEDFIIEFSRQIQLHKTNAKTGG